MSYLELVRLSLLQHIPEILGWVVGVILAVRVLRSGGGKAEKLFLAGCSLKLVVYLVIPFMSGLVNSLMHQGGRNLQTTALIFQLPLSILSLAGFVCLVYAFWLKFWTRKQGI